MFNLDTLKKKIKPFPYAIIDNFINNYDLDHLNKNFPHYLFDRITETDPKFLLRKNLAVNEPSFQKFIKKDKIWSKFTKDITSKKFVSLLIEYFNPEMKEFGFNMSLKRYRLYIGHNYRDHNLWLFQRILKKIKNKYNQIHDYCLGLVNIPSIRIDFECSRSKSGYNLPPHADQNSKFIVCLFYLNDMNDIDGNDISNLIFYENLKLDKNKWERIPKEFDLKEFCSVGVRKNRAVLMLNSKNSWHGIKEYQSDEYRKFFYLSLAITNFKNIWQ